MAFNKFGTTPITTYVPNGTITFVGAIAILIGFFANCMLIVCDITRYAKNRKEVVISSFVGVIPASLFLIGIGAVLGIIAGTADMAVVFSNMGLPVLGALALIVAAWTSNSTTVYSAGLAVLRITNLKDDKRTIVTAIAGSIGTVMAAVGIMGQFEAILVILSVLTPPIAGIMIADYWIIGKGNKNNWGIIPGVNWAGIVAWGCGILVGIFIKVGSTALNSVLVSMILYLVLINLVGNKLPVDKKATETK
jgi:cytosine permease